MTLSSLLPFVLLIGAFWLLVIRPTQRQRAAKAALLAALQPGAEVVTTGGLHGTVVEMDDEDVVLEVADGVQLRFVRSAIGAVKADDVASDPGTSADAGASDEDGPDLRTDREQAEHSGDDTAEPT